MIPVFLGWDAKETVAYHVLAHSIIRRASVPVAICPLNRDSLWGHYWRDRGPHDSTDFSNSRWAIPSIMDYDGWAIFMDCDMLCLADINDLWKQRDDRYAVMVKKHNYQPSTTTKFLNQQQSDYGRKNWSSLMLINTSRCRELSRQIVSVDTNGLYFHQFKWLQDREIGEIEGGWNHLVGELPQPVDETLALLHYTIGGPWHGYNENGGFTEAWWSEYRHMQRGSNPVDFQAVYLERQQKARSVAVAAK